MKSPSVLRPGPLRRRASSLGFIAAAGPGLAVLLCMGLSLVAVPPATVPASAAGSTWYAYAGGEVTTGASACSQTATQADQCTLAEALSLATAGGTVYLATAGSSALYIGNWDVTTPGTSASAPLTIEPAPTVANPTLDGDGTGAGTCQTATGCEGPVLTIGDAYVDIDDMTIQNAFNPDLEGGAIDNSNGGTLTVNGSTFSNDVTTGDGGAIDNGDGTGGTCTLAGLTCTLTVIASTFSGNFTTNGDGGAIDNADNGGSGTLTVSGSTFSNNVTSVYARDGGAIDNADNGGDGTFSVSGSTFSGNTANFDGGAIDNGDNNGSGTLTVSGSTFSGNSTADGIDGGAIDNGDHGGGGNSSTLGVSGSTFSGNTANFDGGAIDNADNGGDASLIVTTSTFSTNAATDMDGGAIDSGDEAPGSGNPGNGDLTVTTSTFWSNTAGSDGGAIDEGDNGGSGAAGIVASTLAGNQLTPVFGQDASNDGAAVDNADNGGSSTMAVAADIFSEATSAVVALCNQGGGTWADDGYNVASDPSCFSSTPASTDDESDGLSTLLGGLAANGGPTETVLPLPGNPAIGVIPDQSPPITVDVGSPDPAVALCPTTDQRGVATLPGEPCDAGSVQVALPVAQDHAYATPEGTELTETAGVLQAGVSDDNPGATSWTAQLVSPASDGSATVNPDGSIAYTPDAGFVGTDSFTYTLTDNLGYTSAPATVTIYVGPVFSISVNGSSTAATTTYGSPVDLGESGVPPGTTGQVGFEADAAPTSLCTLTFPTTSSGCPSSVNLVPGPYTVSATLTSTATNNVTSAVNTVQLTVDPAPLTVTASSAVMTYGGTVPLITASYSGFVLTENASSLTTAPTCSTTATSSSPPGVYPSTCTGAVDPDYAISYVAGTVTVSGASTSPAPPTTTTTTSPLTTASGPTTTPPPATSVPRARTAPTTTAPTTTAPPTTAPPSTTAPPTTTAPTTSVPTTAPPTTTAPRATTTTTVRTRPRAPSTHKKPSAPATTTTKPPPTTATLPPTATSVTSPPSSTPPKSKSSRSTKTTAPPVPTTTTTRPVATTTTTGPRATATATPARPTTTTAPAGPAVLAYTGADADELVELALAIVLLGGGLALMPARGNSGSRSSRSQIRGAPRATGQSEPHGPAYPSELHQDRPQ
jgi:Bacterial Ig domain/MBG domain (YGX type)